MIPGTASLEPDEVEEKPPSDLRSCSGHASWPSCTRSTVWTFRASMLHRNLLPDSLEKSLDMDVSSDLEVQFTGLIGVLTGVRPSGAFQNSVHQFDDTDHPAIPEHPAVRRPEIPFMGNKSIRVVKESVIQNQICLQLL